MIRFSILVLLYPPMCNFEWYLDLLVRIFMDNNWHVSLYFLVTCIIVLRLFRDLLPSVNVLNGSTDQTHLS